MTLAPKVSLAPNPHIARMPERRIWMLRTTSAYPDNEGKPPSGGTPTQPERRGVGRRTIIEAAKEKVATKDLADLLCGQAKMQRPVRVAIDQVRFEQLRRRVFRRFFGPSLVRIADTEEREAEAAILWEATELLVRLLVAQLRGGGE